MKNIGVDASDDGDWRRGKDAGEEAKDQQNRPGRGQRARQCEDGEGKEGGEQDDLAAKSLTERTEDQGTEDVAEEI